ncbi:MAG: hypothetical protein KatS3mg026_1415 [Bacteroidia bacterium]|nr:MAG: hypothetical protein KatS3mg026_1415 [Bacteroidia bacterium]
MFSLGREHYPQGLRLDLALTPAKAVRSCLEGLVLNQATQAPVREVQIILIDPAGGRRRITSQNGGTFKGCVPPRLVPGGDHP